MSRRLSRFLAIALLAVSSAGMVAVSFDAEARRMGGGSSAGRQSSNVTQQRDAATPSSATTTQRSATAAAPAAGAAAAGTAAKSGMSRFLGPIAGIAAGLGIAALLSHLGMSGAFLEMISSLLLIGLLVFAVLFIVRRLRGGAAAPAAQGAAAGSMQRTAHESWQPQAQQPQAAPVSPAAPPAFSADRPADTSWYIPGDFDTPTFLANAKKQFIEIQKIWDSGNVAGLSEYLTDDLIAEMKPQIEARGGKTEFTEVVLLNAELLGIETVSDGHLASVRYSGMLREAPGAEAFRFEEVWNLYKAEGAGWLLAGIQQIPVQN